jgi:hypothetical protein
MDLIGMIRMLDPNDFSAQISEHHRCKRAGIESGQIEDSYAL